MGKFTEVELDVMRILWERGELKPAEIIAAFPRPVKNSAMRSFLAVLTRKGHVVRRRKGKAYYYKACTKPDSALNLLLRRTIDVFFGGSTEALLCRLIRAEKYSDKQLMELKRLADRRNPPGKTSGKPDPSKSRRQKT
ncbi:MAG: BlaI/MecI/CopY family transcriptional regulator [Candidatus Sumerlaeota bacterium]|nr:BlaI/MecI/CopY family transcriptional regulator [Candidatus Sumerlaeota bacterium]